MKLAIALASSAFALPALAQNLLINGSFEQPALAFEEAPRSGQPRARDLRGDEPVARGKSRAEAL